MMNNPPPQQSRAEMFEENIWNEMRKDPLGARVQHDPTLQLLVKAVAATLDRAIKNTDDKMDMLWAGVNRLLSTTGKPEGQ